MSNHNCMLLMEYFVSRSYNCECTKLTEGEIKGFTVAVLKPDLVASGKVNEVIERVKQTILCLIYPFKCFRHFATNAFIVNTKFAFLLNVTDFKSLIFVNYFYHILFDVDESSWHGNSEKQRTPVYRK